jgi:molybdopterin synthase catalytic subunit/molybdopterin converting factor small subunit
MRVKLLSFGVLRDLLPDHPGDLELPPGARVQDVLELFQTRSSSPTGLWSSVAVAVNREYVPASHLLADGDEVALLPPVSGGSAAASANVALTTDPIQSTALAEDLKRGEDGAVVVFDGIVRNNTRGRRTLYLFYEAYAEMAMAQMRDLARQATERFPIREVSIVHRLGRLEVGETSVLIAVASAHRGAAFDACRWIIDTLKQTVPIWKKEFFEDGAVWAQGEPFPPELAAQPGPPPERVD